MKASPSPPAPPLDSAPPQAAPTPRVDEATPRGGAPRTPDEEAAVGSPEEPAHGPTEAEEPPGAEARPAPRRIDVERIEAPIPGHGTPADKDTVIRAVRAAFEATGGQIRGWPKGRLEADEVASRPELKLVRSFADEVVRRAEELDARDEAVDVRIAEVMKETPRPRAHESDEVRSDPSVPVPEGEPFEPDPDPWRPLEDADS